MQLSSRSFSDRLVFIVFLMFIISVLLFLFSAWLYLFIYSFIYIRAWLGPEYNFRSIRMQMCAGMTVKLLESLNPWTLSTGM